MRPRCFPLFFAALCLAALCLAASCSASRAQVGKVFVIDMENHNLTQPASVSSPQPIKGNPAAPFMNRLITPGDALAAQVSWASNYHSTGTHPSLTNYGVTNNNEPYTSSGGNGTGSTNLTETHLTGLLQNAGIGWKSYQEDIDLAAVNGRVTSTVLPASEWMVPLTNLSGTSAAYTNAYNNSHQYDYATKHNGTVYFSDTNGGYDQTTANAMISHYAPLQQLSTDLAAGTSAAYNLITPDEFNDGHTPLNNGFDYNGVHYTGDAASIAQADNFLSLLVPQIMASDDYKNNGVILIWWDETEGGDSFDFTLPEMLISPLAKGNGFESALDYTHSSDLKTMQEIFNVRTPNGGFLGDANAASTNDFAELFRPGVVLQALPAAAAPEPAAGIFLSLGVLVSAVPIVAARRKRRTA